MASSRCGRRFVTSICRCSTRSREESAATRSRTHRAGGRAGAAPPRARCRRAHPRAARDAERRRPGKSAAPCSAPRARRVTRARVDSDREDRWVETIDAELGAMLVALATSLARPGRRGPRRRTMCASARASRRNRCIGRSRFDAHHAPDRAKRRRRASGEARLIQARRARSCRAARE